MCNCSQFFCECHDHDETNYLIMRPAGGGKTTGFVLDVLFNLFCCCPCMTAKLLVLGYCCSKEKTTAPNEKTAIIHAVDALSSPSTMSKQ